MTRSYQKRCKIPEEWKHLIEQVVSTNVSAISKACGSLELVYRRTLAHAEELKEIDNS